MSNYFNSEGDLWIEIQPTPAPAGVPSELFGLTAVSYPAGPIYSTATYPAVQAFNLSGYVRHLINESKRLRVNSSHDYVVTLAGNASNANRMVQP